MIRDGGTFAAIGITLLFVALVAFAIWARGVQNERYYQCRMNHDKDYCMWHSK